MNRNVLSLKYEKYRNKYMKLQNGGVNIFNLYVTGISDTGSNKLINTWNNVLRYNVLGNIHHNFDTINITYYDPCFSDDDTIDETKKKK